ncbi:hypothetical protein BG452_06125 [Streptomyces sp. CBMA123]|nr:hypothetical protein [Streptomyces sp. CBMA123]
MLLDCYLGSGSGGWGFVLGEVMERRWLRALRAWVDFAGSGSVGSCWWPGQAAPRGGPGSRVGCCREIREGPPLQRLERGTFPCHRVALGGLN